MPKIDFYILPETGRIPRLQLLCRLVEKAYPEKHQIYIHASDQNEATLIDQLLWTYREESFIPHGFYGDNLKPIPPVQIGFQTTPEDHRDILINLSDDVPSFYQQFSRILEIVSDDPEQKTKARDRYKIYRDQLCELTTHKI
jgi:DNA polymerase-3 subunit chi